MTESEPLVEVTDLQFSYGDQAPALLGISLTIGSGEFVALAGANGSGKTTLAKHFNGLLRPARGEVRVAGRDARGRSIGELAQTVGYVFQNPDHQIFLPTVAEEVAFGPRNLGVRGEELDERVEEALALFDLTDERHRHPTLLGRGVRRRVALAAVHAMRPRLLVLDEPTGGLDRRASEGLMATLRGLVAEERSVVLITHDMKLVGEHARRLVLLNEGRVLADGPTADVMRQFDLVEQAGIRPPPVARLSVALASVGMPFSLNVDEFTARFAERAPSVRLPADGGST
ncbi:MAG: ABC transporter ATP-binding protein [Nitrolancea sp.]